MIKDKNGNILSFGDRVIFFDDWSGIEYVFTIELMQSDGWIWGGDIPEDHKWDYYGHENFHNPEFVVRQKRQPWGSSKLEFKFV